MKNIDNNEMELNPINPIIESEEIQNTEAENDFLKSLDDDFAENGEPVLELDESLMLKQGEASAVGLLSMGECLVQQFGHKDFALDPSQKEAVSKSFAPLFVKHGGELPAWATQYKEEIMFTFAFGTMCFTSYSQVKTLKKVDAKKIVNKIEAEDEADATS